MSKLGKIILGITAVFMAFMFCMVLLGGALLFITNGEQTVSQVNERVAKVLGWGVLPIYGLIFQNRVGLRNGRNT